MTLYNLKSKILWNIQFNTSSIFGHALFKFGHALFKLFTNFIATWSRSQHHRSAAIKFVNNLSSACPIIELVYNNHWHYDPQVVHPAQPSRIKSSIIAYVQAGDKINCLTHAHYWAFDVLQLRVVYQWQTMDKSFFHRILSNVKQHMFISVLNYFAEENSFIFMIRSKSRKGLWTF